MADIEFKYKGYEISYFEYTEPEKWSCYALDKEDTSLKNLKKKIDTFLKAECKFKNIPCIAKNSYASPFRATITSICNEGRDVWIRHHDKSRSKFRRNEIYSLCDENIKIINRLEQINREQDVLQDEENGLEHKLIPMDFEEAK